MFINSNDQFKVFISHSPKPVIFEEQVNPHKETWQFRHTFRYSYAKAELLDLLEGVVTYNGAKEICRADLVMFYRHLLYLVRLVYKMEKSMACEIS